eukprot:m.44977 g.44977  ORF g.44977 m.44977 type:complete len:53 (+) comp19835_c0_seq1:72-230(+)
MYVCTYVLAEVHFTGDKHKEDGRHIKTRVQRRREETTTENETCASNSEVQCQ